MTFHVLLFQDKLYNSDMVDRSIGRLVDWSIGRLVDWSIGRLVDWSIGRLVDWSIGQILPNNGYLYLAFEQPGQMYS